MSEEIAAATSESSQQLAQPSVNQSIAAAVQNATDLLRNISTMETTVIGVASAKWLAEPANVAYKEIIDNAKENITFAVENLAKVGTTGAGVISDLAPK